LATLDLAAENGIPVAAAVLAHPIQLCLELGERRIGKERRKSVLRIGHAISKILDDFWYSKDERLLYQADRRIIKCPDSVAFIRKNYW
jgi:hypothetical protein